jgi:hypothetical protein
MAYHMERVMLSTLRLIKHRLSSRESLLTDYISSPAARRLLLLARESLQASVMMTSLRM